MESEKIALVTGASRGIGKAIAALLAARGFFVVGTATSNEGVQKVELTLQTLNVKGAAVVLDVASNDSVEATFTSILKTWGAPTVLVNNAGITRDNLLLRLKEEDWNAVINTNLTGVYRLTKACLRGMLKSEEGRIVNISSVIGAMGNPGQVHYAASKAGLEGFTRALAREVAGRNITVNAVAPGYIDTEMTQNLEESQKQAIFQQIPLRRLGKPSDVAEMVVFLASSAAGYITGQTFHVNGGLFMH